MLRIALATAALFATGAVIQDSWNWGTDRDEWSNDPDFAASKAICRRLGRPVAPVADRPTAAQARTLKGCSSETLYYTPGSKPDYVKARLCAMTEDEPDNPGDVFRGKAILMQIYANGQGVARNLDLATAYACELSDAAAAESDGRVMHLQALKAKPEPFDYCEDVTSGVHQSVCAAQHSEAAAIGRNTRIKALTDPLSPAAAAQYRAMTKAFDAFLDAMVDGEVEHGGTAHGAIEIEAEDRVRDQFVRDLTRLLNGTWPVASPEQAKAADARLNVSYRKVLTAVGEIDQDTASEPTIASVRSTQRAWLAYRDAYLRFAALAAPSVNRASLLVRLTNLRIAQLEQL